MGNLDELKNNNMNTKPGRMFFVFDSSRLCNMCAVCATNKAHVVGWLFLAKRVYSVYDVASTPPIQ